MDDRFEDAMELTGEEFRKKVIWLSEVGFSQLPCRFNRKAQESREKLPTLFEILQGLIVDFIAGLAASSWDCRDSHPEGRRDRRKWRNHTL